MSLPPGYCLTIQTTGIINSPSQQAHFTRPFRSVLHSVSQGLTPVPTHTCTHQHTKAQTNPSEIFNHARQLASPLPSFIILYLPACSLGSSVVSAVFPSFPFFCSSVQLFQRSPHQPMARTYSVQLSLIYFTFLFCLSVFPLLCFTLYYPPPPSTSGSAFVRMLGENPLSSSILPPSVLSLSLSLCLFISSNIFISLSSPHAPALYSLP